MSFLGQFEHNLDAKDRVTVPSKYRAQVSDGVILVRGLNPSVWVFSPAGFEKFKESFVGSTNPLGRKGQMIRSHFAANAFDDTLDSAGRVRIPKKLQKHAGLEEGACVVAGADDYFEVWDPEAGRTTSRRWRPRSRASPSFSRSRTDKEDVMELRTATIQRGGQAAATAKMAYVPPDHDPVLPEELVEVLDPKPGETFVDCTFGAGGHARLIAERLGSEGELIAIDRDPTAESRWREFSATRRRGTRFLRADFVAGLEGLRGEGVRPDGIVFDFGMSSMQIDAWERGFSYAYDAPLDMRMDPDQKLSAMEVVNEWPQERIARVLRDFGEERRAGSIAREIVRRRPIETTSELVAAIKAAIPPADRFGRGHPAKRAFQAIRIAVNGELEAIDRALPLAWSLLAVGGRLGTISFHSLEDRSAKQFLAARARGCVCPPEIPVCVCGREPEAELVTKRALAPTPEEIERNPRSASAHLRAARKIREEGPAD